jgi:ATP-dependent helicase HrpA
VARGCSRAQAPWAGIGAGHAGEVRPVRRRAEVAAQGGAAPPPAAPERQAYTAWTFGELPELMEIRKGGQVLIGFPALIDKGAHVEIEVFDEPDVAAPSTAPACAAWWRCRSRSR